MHLGLPPGPAEHPLLQAIRFGQDPYGFLERNAQIHGPVFTLRLPGDPPRIVVSEPRLIRQIFALKADEIGASPQGIPVNLGEHNLLFLDGEAHRRDRQLLMPALHGEQLKSYAVTMLEVTEAALAELVPGARVDMHRLLQKITLEIILRCVFGVREPAQLARIGRPVAKWLEGTFVPAVFFAGMVAGWSRVRGVLDRAATRALNGEARGLAKRLPWNRVGQAKAEVITYLRADLEHCRRHGADGRSDILAMVAKARYEDGSLMAMDHAVDELVTMLVGGHETTANTLAWTLSHLLPRPDLLARLGREIEDHFAGGPIDATRCHELLLLDACLKESMRTSPIAPAVPRVAAKELELGEWTIPAGCILFPCTYVTHHRADLWPEPHVYRPERFLDGDTPPADRFFPFGGGRRACIGMAFARSEMRIVLATLLARADMRLVGAAPKRAVIRGLTIAPRELAVDFTPRARVGA